MIFLLIADEDSTCDTNLIWLSSLSSTFMSLFSRPGMLYQEPANSGAKTPLRSRHGKVSNLDDMWVISLNTEVLLMIGLNYSSKS